MISCHTRYVWDGASAPQHVAWLIDNIVTADEKSIKIALSTGIIELVDGGHNSLSLSEYTMPRTASGMLKNCKNFRGF
jgi:hypothetical protein